MVTVDCHRRRSYRYQSGRDRALYSKTVGGAKAGIRASKTENNKAPSILDFWILCDLGTRGCHSIYK